MSRAVHCAKWATLVPRLRWAGPHHDRELAAGASYSRHPRFTRRGPPHDLGELVATARGDRYELRLIL